jgi:hypothetical protein
MSGSLAFMKGCRVFTRDNLVFVRGGPALMREDPARGVAAIRMLFHAATALTYNIAKNLLLVSAAGIRKAQIA